MISWRQALSETYEMQAEAIEAALFVMAKLDGMFEERSDVNVHLKNTANLLAMEAENRRKLAEKNAENPPFTLSAVEVH